MKLKEYIVNATEEYIKIGAVNGCAFIFAGKVTDSVKYLIEKDEFYYSRYAEARKTKRFNNATKRHELSPRANQIQSVLPRWVTLLNREIVETFKADTVGDEYEPTIIMIKGFEIGLYWTVSEFLSGKGQEETYE